MRGFPHKLNYFSFCLIFEVLIIIKNLQVFNFQVWTADLQVQKLKIETPINIFKKMCLLFFVTITLLSKNWKIEKWKYVVSNIKF
jgi:hypothetical protein